MSQYFNDDELTEECKRLNEDYHFRYVTDKAEAVQEFNEWFLCSEGGAVKICSMKNPNIQMPYKEARTHFNNIKIYKMSARVLNGSVVINKPKPELAFEIWAQSPGTIKYMGTWFRPGLPFGKNEEDGFSYFNLWRGIETKPNTNGSCYRYLENIFYNICNKNIRAYSFVMDFMAQIVQHPERKTGISLVITGPQGNGKNTFIEHFMEMVGKKITQKIPNAEITGQFNSLLKDKLVVFIDESITYEGHTVNNKLKSMITDSILTINQKGVAEIEKDNFIRFIFATNLDIAVPIEDGNRRYVTLGSQKNIDSPEFWDAIDDEFKTKDGAGKLYEILMNWDSSHRNWKQIPIFDDSYITARLHTIAYENPVLLWLHHSIDGINTSAKTNPFLYTKERVGNENEQNRRINKMKREDYMLNFSVSWRIYLAWKERNKITKTLDANAFAQMLAKYIPSEKIGDIRYKNFWFKEEDDRRAFEELINRALFGSNTIKSYKPIVKEEVQISGPKPRHVREPISENDVLNPKYIKDEEEYCAIVVYRSEREIIEDILFGHLKALGASVGEVDIENWLVSEDGGV